MNFTTFTLYRIIWNFTNIEQISINTWYQIHDLMLNDSICTHSTQNLQNPDNPISTTPASHTENPLILINSFNYRWSSEDSQWPSGWSFPRWSEANPLIKWKIPFFVSSQVKIYFPKANNDRFLKWAPFSSATTDDDGPFNSAWICLYFGPKRRTHTQLEEKTYHLRGNLSEDWRYLKVIKTNKSQSMWLQISFWCRFPRLHGYIVWLWFLNVNLYYLFFVFFS